MYVRPERRDDRDPRSGLGEPAAASDPSLPEEEREERVRRMRGRAGRVLGVPEGKTWSNAAYAGRTFELPPELRKRFPDGVSFSHEGFPEFDRYAVKTVEFAEGFRGPRAADFRRANEIFGWRDTPPGFVWHHKEDNRTLLLLDRRLHQAVRHYGGVRVSRRIGTWGATATRRPTKAPGASGGEGGRPGR